MNWREYHDQRERKRLHFEDVRDFAEKMKIAEDEETLAQLEEVGMRPVQFNMPFVELFQVISLVQLAVKHPEVRETLVGEFGRRWVDDIQEQLAANGLTLIADVIERGKV
jgi:hypothetical protein